MTSRIDRLTAEIGHVRGSLLYQVEQRREHSSYGNRKSDIVATYHRLEGLVLAWLYVTGTWNRAASVLLTEPTHDLIRLHLGIDLAGLRKQALDA